MTSDRVSNDHMSPVAPNAIAQSVAELQTFLTEQDGVVTNITNEVSFGESIMLVLHELARLQHHRSPVTVSDEMVDRAHEVIKSSFRNETWEFGPPSLVARKALTAALAPAEQEGSAAPTHPGGDSRVVAQAYIRDWCQDHVKDYLAAMTAERDAAIQAADAFADICDELGVDRDNEAGLIAVADLKASLAAAREALKPFDVAARALFTRNYNRGDVVVALPVDDSHPGQLKLTAGTFFDARAALAGSNG